MVSHGIASYHFAYHQSAYKEVLFVSGLVTMCRLFARGFGLVNGADRLREPLQPSGLLLVSVNEVLGLFILFSTLMKCENSF